MADGDFKVLDSPLYPLPSREQYEADPAAVQAYLLKRNERIALEATDPWRYGYRPPVWELVEQALGSGKREILILGGNRASKSEYCGKKAIEVMMKTPGARVWCLQSTEANSIEMQQPILWRNLPAEYRELKKGRVVNISYTQKNGFSDSKFIFPNSSECVFRHYSQADEVIEGGDCDLIWCDELVPLNWIETLRYRLVTRAGILLISFTPIQGWTPTIKEYLDGAKTLLWADAPLLPRGALGRGGNRVPRVQQPARANAQIIYFHTSDNPFGGYETLIDTLAGAPKEEILCRAYGVPTRSIVQRFPRFRDSVHVVAPEAIPSTGTNYHIVDPASHRNWFMIWVRVTPDNCYYVYREWPGGYIPGEGDPGPWAEADGRLADGRAGPAQSGFGWGLKRYVEEIDRLEGRDRSNSDQSGETIAERWMDSRFAAQPNTRADSATTLLEECLECGLAFMPAPADPIEEGVSLINDLLDYDAAGERQPRLYISEACPNTIFALKIWSGRDREKGATKDPIDCLRYAAVGNLCCFAPEELTLVAPGAY
jgi:hypothetical protein